jgi:hypothetical protein
MAENFRLVTPVEKVDRKDIPMTDRTLLNPNHANPLFDGEFVEYDANYRAIRAGGDILSWATWAERGRSDTQAIGKVPVFYMGTYEADTLIMLATGIILGEALMVDDVTIGIVAKSGLVQHGGGTELVVGYCTRIPANNGQRLRFMQTMV